MIFSFVIIGLLILVIILMLVLRPSGDKSAKAALEEALRTQAGHLDRSFQALRADQAEQQRQLRQELAQQLSLFMENQSRAWEGMNRNIDEKFSSFIRTASEQSAEGRERLLTELKEFGLVQRNRMDEYRVLIREGMRDFKSLLATEMQRVNETQAEKLTALDQRQQGLINATEKQLEQIRETVDEKLQKTLHERLGHSFELVRGQLESVQKGLGEMQTLAQDVGGLKKVLSNVKMRGGFGEVQLQMLLDQILAPGQFEANVATKTGSIERVEFAVKFPNREGDREYVWLPIDAKFPKDAYEQLQLAYDQGEPIAIEQSQKALELTIRKMARDISEKYLDAPNTTNFGIMFLPFEGLFAEVVRKASLLEDIQRDCKVIITGPTTLAVILNSLQMGFRTLAIQKRSSEVWQVLSTVKREFVQFEGLLDKVQGHLKTGLNQLEDVMGKRTRAINRKLKDVELLEGQADPEDLILDQ